VVIGLFELDLLEIFGLLEVKVEPLPFVFILALVGRFVVSFCFFLKSLRGY